MSNLVFPLSLEVSPSECPNKKHPLNPIKILLTPKHKKIGANRIKMDSIGVEIIHKEIRVKFVLICG